SDTSGKGNKAWIPESSASSNARSNTELLTMGFNGIESQNDNSEIFSEFMKQHGPRQNEPIFQKSFMDAFTEPGDIEHSSRAAHQKDLLLQAGVVFEEERDNYSAQFRTIGKDDADAEYRRLFGNNPTLADHLHRMGVTDTLIMGQVSYYCALETSVGAAAKGFSPTLISDLSLSWVYIHDPTMNTEQPTLVWRKTRDRGGNDLGIDPNHRRRIQEHLEEITAPNEAHKRGLEGEQLRAVKDLEIGNATVAIPGLDRENSDNALQIPQKYVPAMTAKPGL
ncbi:MAG: hypothetical protein HY370_05980, partial [Proteobacteria bacterium]|nr:hypothetical protein [Pseudomonadota bacterium]